MWALGLGWRPPSDPGSGRRASCSLVPWSPKRVSALGICSWATDLDAALTTATFEHFVLKNRPPCDDASDHLLLREATMRIGVVETGPAVTSPSLRPRPRRLRALAAAANPPQSHARLDLLTNPS